MKTIVSIFIASILCVLVMSSCFAEDFIIHSDVMFGDTREEVIAKESLELTHDFETRVCFKGKVAGHENAGIDYYFDDNGKLYDALYCMNDSYLLGLEGVLDEYKELLEALSNKYGPPLDKDDVLYNTVWGYKLKDTERVKPIVAPATIIDEEYSAWSIKYDNYYIKIELIYHQTTNSSGISSLCYIDYHPYTEEELAKEVEEYKKNKESANDDL